MQNEEKNKKKAKKKKRKKKGGQTGRKRRGVWAREARERRRREYNTEHGTPRLRDGQWVLFIFLLL